MVARSFWRPSVERFPRSSSTTEVAPWSYHRHHATTAANLIGDVQFGWNPGLETASTELRTRAFEALVDAHAVRIDSDSAFQRRARLLQSLWREAKGIAPGLHRGRPLGSRLPADVAGPRLANFITPEIGQLVMAELADAKKPGSGRLISTPRIFEDLLSSQPLCFNMFGPLAVDAEGLGTRVFQRLFLTRGIRRVTSIQFERSPGRHDEDGTQDRSAFDVFVEFDSLQGQRGFIGIEVKYHESLRDPPAKHRASYDRIAAGMGAFLDPAAPALRKSPLQQIWRDHLLAGALLQRRYETGFFLFLAPEANEACRVAVSEYEDHLADGRTFEALALENVAHAIAGSTSATWIDEVWRRYFDFELIDRLVTEEARRSVVGA